MDLRTKRAYEPPAASDGKRILVDRIWPRGVSKEAAEVEAWFRDLAPSDELRKWFGHDPALWTEFQRRYARELDEGPDGLEELIALVRESPRVTLVFGARDEEHNNAVALEGYLRQARSGS